MRQWFINLALAIAILSISAGVYSQIAAPSGLTHRVNGNPIKKSNIPYEVSIRSRNNKVFVWICEGVLIGLNKILTAAHCFKDDAGFTLLLRYLRAVAGDDKVETKKERGAEGQWRFIKNVTYPKYYVKYSRHDIAIVFTNATFTLSDTVKLMSQARVFDDYIHDDCQISGFGQQENNKTVFMKHSTGIKTEHHCAQSIGSLFSIRVLCPNTVIRELTKHNSGAPLICFEIDNAFGAAPEQGVLVGLRSGTRHGHSYYIRVSTYYSWITANGIPSSANSLCCIYVFIWICLLNAFFL